MKRAFSLIELLVVMAIIGILAAFLLPVLRQAKEKARGAVCLNNLHQVNLATRMYAEDHNDAVVLPSGFVNSRTDYQLYKQYVKRYAGYKGVASPSEKLFACPSDTFFWSRGDGSGSYNGSGFCAQPFTDFTSYAFNGGNRNGTNFPGIAGVRLAAVRVPAKTLLIFEAAALTPFSWHEPQKTPGDYRVLNSVNAVSFVDGHARYVKMYFDTNGAGEAWQQNPPAGYDYQWSGD